MYKRFKLLLDYCGAIVAKQIKLEQYIMRSGLCRSYKLEDNILEIRFKDNLVENPYEAIYSILSDARKGGILRSFCFVEIREGNEEWN